MRIEIPLHTAMAVTALPGELVSKRYHPQTAERGAHYVKRLLTEPVYLELEINGADLEEMARRALTNKTARCKDGAFLLRVRGGRKAIKTEVNE